uniref:Uncharacterized protein n=1 Tax=Triticum urartu TaxID=4572 RepID=A0A8R7QRP8_TRIUA
MSATCPLRRRWYFDVRRDTCPFWRMMFLQACYTDGHLEEPATVAVLHFHADNGSMDQQEISKNSVRTCRLAYLLRRLQL